MSLVADAAKRFSLAALCMVLAGPAGSVAPQRSGVPAKPLSYLALPGGGVERTPPYVWLRRVGARQLVVLGTRHIRNPGSPMYARLQAALDRASPQVIIHEGVIPPRLGTLSHEKAIAIGADLGFTARFAHDRKVPLRSGDAPLKHEIAALLRQYPAGDVLVFLVAQRHIGGGRPDERALVQGYPTFRTELEANGLPMQAPWARWDGFLGEYRRVVGKPFSAASWNARMLDPTRTSGGRLNEIGRGSAAIRDRHLMSVIRSALRQHDRVAVVFGVWHVLAIEPLLAGAMTVAPARAPRAHPTRSRVPRKAGLR